MNKQEILKIRYAVWTYYKCEDGLWAYYKNVYDLTSDGKIRWISYTQGDRKGYDKHVSTLASKQDYQEFCEKINACENQIDRIKELDDNCVYEVKIYRSFGRLDILHGCSGTSDTTLLEIIWQYLEKFSGVTGESE